MTQRPLPVLLIDHGVSFGGSGVVAAHLLRYFDPATVQPVLVCAMPSEHLAAHLPPGADVIRMAPVHDYLEARRWRQAADRLPGAMGLVASQVATLGGLARNIKYGRAIVRVAQQRRIGLVHLNNGFANVSAALAVRLAGVPMVAHAHALEVPSRLGRAVAAGCRRTIAVSGMVRDSLLEFGYPGWRIVTLPNPVPVPVLSRDARADARRRLGLPHSAPVFGLVGRIVPWKGQRQFLAAALRVLAELPDAHVLIVGEATDDGAEYAAEVRAEIARTGVADRIHLPGFIAEMSAVYAALDVLVHSSIEPEPFGLVITEAMAHGVPVVAAERGAPREIIRDGYDGFLRNPHDPVAVAKTIVALLSDTTMHQQISERALALVRERYDPKRYASEVAEVYAAGLEEG